MGDEVSTIGGVNVGVLSVGVLGFGVLNIGVSDIGVLSVGVSNIEVSQSLFCLSKAILSFGIPLEPLASWVINGVETFKYSAISLFLILFVIINC